MTAEGQASGDDGPAAMPARSARPPGVRPLRIVALVSLVLLGGVVVGLGAVSETLIVDQVSQAARGRAADLARIVTAALRRDRADGEGITRSSHEGRTPDGTRPDETRPDEWRPGKGRLDETRRAMREAAHVLPGLRMRLYTPEGAVVLVIGSAVGPASARGDDPDLQMAFSGQTAGGLDGTVHKLFQPVCLDGPGGPVTAVLETDQDLERVMAGVGEASRTLTIIGVAVMILLYAALLWVAWVLDHVVRQQREALEHEAAERQDALVHLRRVQDAMETTILERTRRLRDSESRFRAFAESASDWLWEVDDHMRYTFISEGFRRVVGLDPAALIGQARSEFIDVTAPGDDQRWARHEDDLASRRSFRDMRYTLRLPDGQRRLVLVSGAPIIDERRRFRGYRGTTTDITSRELAERTINRLGRIVDQSANEVYIFDAASLRFSQVNRGARRNLGMTLEDLTRLTPSDLMPEEDEASLLRRLDPLRRQPSTSAIFESRFRRQDGTIYPVEVRLQYMAHEQPPVYVALVQDITERRQAARALQESEDRYRATAEMSLDAIVVHAEGRIVFANGQAVSVARAPCVEDLIGQPVTRYVQPEFLGMMNDRLRGLSQLGRPTERTEVVLRRQDGQSFEAEASSTAIVFRGRPAVQTVIRDVSEDKAVQGQLIQTAKLATLGEMAAGMAHELSQPMNVIRMAAEGALLTAERDGRPLSEPLRKVFGLIASQAGRMGDIIDHMRIFSRKEAEGEELFDPGLCVRQALNMIEVQFYAENIDVTARYPDGTVLVRGRPVHLEQVLLNLLTNARDAIRTRLAADGTGPAGRILIDMRLVPPGDAEAGGDPVSGRPAAGPKGTLVIAILDNGGGIPPESLDRVFEPFYTTKEVGTGTGLGLSVSFGLIAAMRGTVVVRNEGAGACFEIRLPAADPRAAVPGRPGAPAGGLTLSGALGTEGEDGGIGAGAVAGAGPRGGRERADPEADEDDDVVSALQTHVMVVDDEPFATKLVSDHLGHLGYRVTTAGDGDEAYRRFLDDPPDIVITDLRMPRSDGGELMARIHGHVPDLPVIVVTGHLGHLEETSLALEEKAVAVVKKPVSLARLAALVREYAGGPGATAG